MIFSLILCVIFATLILLHRPFYSYAYDLLAVIITSILSLFWITSFNITRRYRDYLREISCHNSLLIEDEIYWFETEQCPSKWFDSLFHHHAQMAGFIRRIIAREIDYLLLSKWIQQRHYYCMTIMFVMCTTSLSYHIVIDQYWRCLW